MKMNGSVKMAIALVKLIIAIIMQTVLTHLMKKTVLEVGNIKVLPILNLYNLQKFLCSLYQYF